MNHKMIGNTNAKRLLTKEDVILIRFLSDDGNKKIKQIRSWCTAKSLSKKFGVHQRNIEKIINFETWRHVR